jgi:N-acetylglucosamine-6-sulfatase
VFIIVMVSVVAVTPVRAKQPNTSRLIVSVVGGGKVVSTPRSISCPPTCRHTFRRGAIVRLTPRPRKGWSFGHWTGACRGSGACVTTLRKPTSSVGAVFSAITPLRRLNVILILSDDQSSTSIPKMPYMRSRTGWSRFTNAYINNATCCPSRATILTGQWSHHTGVESTGGAPRFDDSSTLATWLRAAGYHTGLIGKYHLGATSRVPTNYIPPGWDEWVEHEVNDPDCASECPYYNYKLNVNGTLTHRGSAPRDYSTTVLTGYALDFIRRNATHQPFFLEFAPRSPHNPWQAAPRDVGHYGTASVIDPPNWNEADMSDKPRWWRGLPLKSKSDTDGARRNEWDTLLSFDRAVEQIVTEITDLHLIGNTVIIYMTDNGYAYGEHRWSGKVCAYDECSKTPLMIDFRGRSQGYSWPQLVGNEDIAPTIADLAGITPGAPVDGDSFAGFLRTGKAPAGWPNEVLLHGYTAKNEPPGKGNPPTYWAIRTPGYKYIETPSTGEVELYNMRTDPFELRNVAKVRAYADTRAELAARLAALRSRSPR